VRASRVSCDRNDWIDARDLKSGEHIRTKSGASAITAIERKPGAARVFDIEVEGDQASGRMNVVINWFEDVKSRMR